MSDWWSAEPPARPLESLAAALDEVRVVGTVPPPAPPTSGCEGTDGTVWVTGITEDSAAVRPGWLFVARRGTRTDGHRFVPDAVARGAAAVAVEHPAAVSVPQVVVPNTAAAAGPLADAFHGHPSRQLEVVGVTGTNGKTTTCELIRACIDADGRVAGQIGTIATHVGHHREPASMTTPAPADLQRHLWRMVQAGVQAVAMEVSSHALDQYRVDGVAFDVGVFTNLDTEHLDYHGTMEHYWASKARLFEARRCRQALVCVDDVWGVRLAHQVDVPVVTFGTSRTADVRYTVEEHGLAGSVVHLDGPDGHLRIPTSMVGSVNGPNVVAAYLAARALGVDRDVAVSALAGCPAPPGRFELVDVGQPFLVVVDYAHTPQALASLIATARRCAPVGGQVRVVVGARGGRDRLKRPRTGAVAASAGWTVLTTDSPGREDPWSIIEQLRLGTVEVPHAEVHVEPDRRRAIALAIASARPGDVVLIVGRGHEVAQHIGDRRVPFDDRREARNALLERRRTGWSPSWDGVRPTTGTAAAAVSTRCAAASAVTPAASPPTATPDPAGRHGTE